MRARSSATAARASASRSRSRCSARSIAWAAVVSWLPSASPASHAIVKDEGDEGEVAETALVGSLWTTKAAAPSAIAEPHQRSVALEEHSEQEGRGENGDEVAEGVGGELSVDDGSDDADHEDRGRGAERVPPPREQREDHGRGPRRVQPGRAGELSVAVVEVEGDLDRCEDRDSDDDEIEPVAPPRVPYDLRHVTKVTHAAPWRIGRADDGESSSRTTPNRACGRRSAVGSATRWTHSQMRRKD